MMSCICQQQRCISVHCYESLCWSQPRIPFVSVNGISRLDSKPLWLSRSVLVLPSQKLQAVISCGKAHV